MNLQEQFDFIVNHLRKQGRTSIDEDLGCAYRSEGGLKCAAGALIPDEVYTPEMETVNWFSIVEYYKKLLPEYLTGYDSVRLIQQLQRVHDDTMNFDYKTGEFISKNLENAFANVAEEFGLQYTPPEELKGVQ